EGEVAVVVGRNELLRRAVAGRQADVADLHEAIGVGRSAGLGDEHTRERLVRLVVDDVQIQRGEALRDETELDVDGAGGVAYERAARAAYRDRLVELGRALRRRQAEERLPVRCQGRARELRGDTRGQVGNRERDGLRETARRQDGHLQARGAAG